MLKIFTTKAEFFDHLEQSNNIKKVNVFQIIESIKKDGDNSLIRLTEQYDKVKISKFRVPDEIIKSSYESHNGDFDLFHGAINNIQKFHKNQTPKNFLITQKDGTKVEWNWRPINRIGAYVPGGNYPLISSLFMNVIPAQIAGVQEIVVCTPPTKDGLPDKTILAACNLLQIKEIYTIGGAQAIAALAIGTESIKKVNKIVGPGNSYVSAAKHALSSKVGIDMTAGPTEIVVLADSKANPSYIASDLISQAEHDTDAKAILITDSLNLVNEVKNNLRIQIKLLATSKIVETSLKNNGLAFVAKDLNNCIHVLNEIAPEHLSLQAESAENLRDKVIAGSIFMGSKTPVAWGDYWAGPNHTLPTNGQAKFRGPLNVVDFLVPFSVVDASNSIRKSGEKVKKFANLEGLSGHAKSIEIRLEDE